MTNEADGSELASVYVPTAPNPTGGYLVIVPTNSLSPLDWSVDQAMTFVVSGGSTAPGSVRIDPRVVAKGAVVGQEAGSVQSAQP
jgi:uncharacterized membrane protein